MFHARLESWVRKQQNLNGSRVTGSSRSGRRRRQPGIQLAACVVALLVGLGAAPNRGFAQSDDDEGLSAAALDSARSALGASDWNERHAALRRINGAYADALPGVLLLPITNLLDREAKDVSNHEEDEAFGEYLVDLVLTAVRTGDSRVVPGLLLVDGLSISSGVAAFVASQGRAVMPALDSLAATREDRASDVAETYALMYARYGPRLARADSAQVLQRLLSAAAHESPAVRAHAAKVVSRGLIAELQSLVAELAVSDAGQIDGVYVVRDDANEALPALQRARAAMPTPELLNRLALLTDGACGAANAQAANACAALRANLADAARLLAAGQPRIAAKALDAYSRTAVRLGVDGLVPRVAAVTLDGTARALIVRLSA